MSFFRYFRYITDILDISPGEGGGLFSEIQLKLFYLSVLDILDIPPEEESILSEIQLRLKILSLFRRASILSLNFPNALLLKQAF